MAKRIQLAIGSKAEADKFNPLLRKGELAIVYNGNDAKVVTSISEDGQHINSGLVLWDSALLNTVAADNVKKVNDAGTTQLAAINEIKTAIDATAATVAQNKTAAETAAETATQKAAEATTLINDAFLTTMGLKVVDGKICMDDNKEA
jgi:hypothetical protein